MPISDERLVRMPLQDAENARNWGEISEEQWKRYAHLWQTSAPRFGLRACQCAECVAKYPTAEGYRPVY